MKPCLRSISLCGAILAAASSAFAADLPAEVAIPNTRHIEFVSQVNQHRYALDIGLPRVAAPPSGYRVLYVLDGYAYFASAVEAVRANLNAPDVVVVGISYPNDAAFIDGVLTPRQPLSPLSQMMPPYDAAVGMERQYDLALPATEAQLAAQSIPGLPTPKVNEVGGLDDFLKTIETEVKPRVAALAPIDRDNQVLFGHSLGGLAVVRALFTEPNAFRTFVAASPSIWWADKAVLAGERAFAAQVGSGAAHPRVLITVGADESKVPKLPPEIPAAAIEKLVGKARMVGNACDLAARLKALPGKPPYEVAKCAVFEDQSHGIATWPALGRAVQFAFAR